MEYATRGELKCSHEKRERERKGNKDTCEAMNMLINPFTMHTYIKSPHCTLQMSYKLICQLYFTEAGKSIFKKYIIYELKKKNPNRKQFSHHFLRSPPLPLHLCISSKY